MKLLLFGDAGSIHTRKWVDMLKSKFEIHVAGFSPKKIPGATCYFIDVGRINPDRTSYKCLLGITRFFRLVKKIKPDLLNAHYLTSYGFMAALVKPKTLPLVLTLYGTDVMVTPGKNILFRAISRYTLNRASHVFSPARHMTREVRGLTKKDIHVTTIQYGVDAGAISQNLSRKRDIDFITARRHTANSNIGLILRAFRKYIDEVNPDVQMYVLGDGPLLEKHKDYAQKRGLSGHMVFTGKVEHARLIDLMKRSRVYISMTSSDGLSLSLLEAMACGCIPVLSDIMANREWITDKQNGYLCSLSPEALCGTLKTLKIRSKIIDSNLHKVRSKGNLEINSRIIVNTLVNIAEGKRVDSKG